MQKEEKIHIACDMGIDYRYLLYRSKTRQGEKLPLIVFLHGAGERGENLSLLKAHSIPQMFDGEVDYPCIVVSPQCAANSFWTAQIPQLKMFIDTVAEQYPVDKERIHLTGVSMGGFGTWHMAMAYPDMFASIVPICGGGMPWNAGVLTMPVRAFHGEADTVVDVRESIAMYESLKKTNQDATLTIFPGVDHNAWDYAYREELIDWMLKQKK